MARDYGRIRVSFWDDERIKPLSMADKMVAAYLLTSNHTNAIGCFKLPLAYVADDLGVTPASLEPIFASLRAINFIKWCERVPWLWIPNYLKHNPPETPNVWRRCVAEMKLLPVELSARAHIAEELFQIAAEERMKTLSGDEKTKLQSFRTHGEGINHASVMHGEGTTRARPSPGPSPGPVPVPEPEESKSSSPPQAAQEPEFIEPDPPPKPKQRRTQIPEDCPSKPLQGQAVQFWGVHARLDLVARVADEAEHFRDHHLKLGSTMADWNAAWRTWYREAVKRSRQTFNGRKESSHEQGQRIGIELITELAGNSGPDYREDHGPRTALPAWSGDDGSGAESLVKGAA